MNFFNDDAFILNQDIQDAMADPYLDPAHFRDSFYGSGGSDRLWFEPQARIDPDADTRVAEDYMVETDTTLDLG